MGLCVGLCVGRLVGRSVGRFVGGLVGRLVGRLLGWLVDGCFVVLADFAIIFALFADLLLVLSLFSVGLFVGAGVTTTTALIDLDFMLSLVFTDLLPMVVGLAVGLLVGGTIELLLLDFVLPGTNIALAALLFFTGVEADFFLADLLSRFEILPKFDSPILMNILILM